MKKILSFLLSAVLTFVCVAAALTIGYVVLTSSEMYEWYTAEAAEETEFGSPYKFYYEKLDNIEKHTYNEIITHIYDMPEQIEVPAISFEQLDRVFSAVLMDNPDLFFVGRKCTLSSKMLKTFCAVDYIISKDEYLAQREEIEKSKQDIISSLSNPEDEWQTELEIHDYIVDNCTYELSEPRLVCSSVYGALINGRAACEGYSRAAKLLFDEVGIESALVSGTSKSEDGNEGPHMWNAVKINGDFYYLDCTWDDPVSANGEEMKIYSYFNVTTKVISKTHSEFSYNFVCIDTAENYFVKTGRYFDGYDRSYEKKIADMISDSIGSGENVQILFGNKKDYRSAVKDLIDNKRVYEVLSLAERLSGEKLSKKSVTYLKDDEHLMLTLIPERG
ncbi:MAG: hypothetical protein IKW12_04950 [Clostridia bacterium]|nr:hypothetical protein [Clostridia bacterium]